MGETEDSTGSTEEWSREVTGGSDNKSMLLIVFVVTALVALFSVGVVICICLWKWRRLKREKKLLDDLNEMSLHLLSHGKEKEEKEVEKQERKTLAPKQYLTEDSRKRQKKSWTTIRMKSQQKRRKKRKFSQRLLSIHL